MSSHSNTHRPARSHPPARYERPPAYIRVLTILEIIVFVALITGLFRYFSDWAGAISTTVGVAAGLGLVTVVGREVRRWPGPRLTRGLVVTVGILELVSVIGIVGIVYYLQHRPIDVTAQVQLADREKLQPGASAAVSIDIPESRRHLVIVFRASDSNPDAGICASSTELDVALDTGGNPGTGSRVALETPLTLDLAPNAREVHLRATMLNPDANCAVNLSVSSAKVTT